MTTAIANNGIYQILAGNAALLVFATATVSAFRSRWERATRVELVRRIRTWWIIFSVFVVALLFGKAGFLVFQGWVSYMAFKEYMSIMPTRRDDRKLIFVAYLIIPAQFLMIGSGIDQGVFLFVPMAMLMVLPGALLIHDDAKTYLRSTGQILWGLIFCVFCVSHLAALRVLPGVLPGSSVSADLGNEFGVGLVLFLVMLTELNDVAQYLWGKGMGRRKISPVLSPNKTLEGFLGGIATTMVLAMLLAPLLTPLSLIQAAFAGALVAIAGFFGDLNLSALKRNLGIKDTGNSLPGHGGILDRIDSLMFTAPVFYYFVTTLIKLGWLP
jgi:phosphatidate cytidylyltransferase